MKEYMIAITGEGSSDFGQKMYGQEEWNWGPVRALIDKCAEKMGIRIILIPVEREEVEKFRLQSMRKTFLGTLL